MNSASDRSITVISDNNSEGCTQNPNLIYIFVGPLVGTKNYFLQVICLAMRIEEPAARSNETLSGWFQCINK